TFVVVAAAIAAITILVPLPMREPLGPPRERPPGRALAAVGAELRSFVRGAFRAFTGSRDAFLAIPLALLPMGAYALSFSLQSNVAVEIGLSDRQIGTLGLLSTLLSGGFCVLGGHLSDRFGRRRTLAIFIAATALPTLALALVLNHHGWVMPVDPTAAGRPVAPGGLVLWFWLLVLAYAVTQGLMYGVGTAIFMDVTTPAVAATQFTAYMALTNAVFAYSSTWQGHAIDAWGYPATLGVDAAFGMVSLLVLRFMGPTRLERRRVEP
ncbi:MAG TPA: MFS transporter, partial [Candidatus Eisenbacteria bacterium]|nr:MFS transporter [Candidatus Eisenbacteria bacterium]